MYSELATKGALPETVKGTLGDPEFGVAAESVTLTAPLVPGAENTSVALPLASVVPPLCGVAPAPPTVTCKALLLANPVTKTVMADPTFALFGYGSLTSGYEVAQGWNNGPTEPSAG